MSYCCFPTFRRSSHKKDQNPSLFRSWLSSCCRCFQPMFRRNPQSSMQITKEPLDSSSSLNQGQQPCKTNSGPCWSRVRVSMVESLQCGNESTLNLEEARMMRTLQPVTQQKLVGLLVPSFPIRSISYFTTFLCSCWDFDIVPYSVEKLFSGTIACILETCPEWCHLPYIPKFKIQEACVQVNSPGADVEPPLHLPLAHVEHQEPCKAETDAPTPCPEQHGPALQPEPAPEKEPPLETGEKQKPAPQHSCLSSAAEKDGSLQKVLLAFSPKLLAEQLTLMDAELFKKVVPWDCLGSIWTHRNKKGNEHLAPTVRAAVTHFNLVAKCVITSCLGDPSMKARDRASVVEHWIQVAKECLRLRNFSSLHAIISALQSTPVHRLSGTWAEVSRKCFLKFKKLCAKDTAESRNLLTKEGLSKKATLENNPQRAQMVQQQKGKGTIPFLGTFLTDLVMLDSAMKDRVDGNLVNFAKIKKETKVLQEIQLFQVAASKYNFQCEENVDVWFHSTEWLNENESYNLSCLLEPRHRQDSNTLRNRKISS